LLFVEVSCKKCGSYPTITSLKTVFTGANVYLISKDNISYTFFMNFSGVSVIGLNTKPSSYRIGSN
jgi:hypothetical protein